VVNAATGSQWCAYPDTACGSGLRWAEANTGDDLAGTCVDGTVDAGAQCTPAITWLSNRTGADDVWKANLDGTGQVALTTSDEAESSASWSRSGDRIAYARLGMIWVMNADGSDQHAITSGTADAFPAWSPDGFQVAFIRSNAIWVVDADGGTPVPLTMPDTSVPYFAWSPDGTRIAFRSNRDGNFEVYAMQADGSGETNLTNSPDGDGGGGTGQIQWSPDSSALLFASDRSGRPDIWWMAADGSSPRNLNASTADENLSGYSWFPDGAAVVFARFGVGPTGGIYLMNPDGTGLRPLIPVTDMWLLNPTVANDGSMLAYNNGDEIYVAAADGSNPLRITNDPGLDQNPTFRPCP
jgi:Tol biopolymer transport system component